MSKEIDIAQTNIDEMVKYATSDAEFETVLEILKEFYRLETHLKNSIITTESELIRRYMEKKK